jgi:hypothetical protein
MLALAGSCLFWFGHNFPTSEQVDERIRVGLRPLQIRDEWFQKELLRYEQQSPELAEEIRQIKERIHRVEGK